MGVLSSFETRRRRAPQDEVWQRCLQPPFRAHRLIRLGTHRPRRQRLKRLPAHQLRQRPRRGAAHQRAGVIEQAFGLGRQGRIAGVADRDQHIAHEPVAADALDRRFGESRAERGIVEPRQIGERGRAQFVARGEFGFAAGLRELVPRADREAIVAAIDAVADRFAKLVRDRALVLDGEIGNAAPRIELVGRRETPTVGQISRQAWQEPQ